MEDKNVGKTGDKVMEKREEKFTEYCGHPELNEYILIDFDNKEGFSYLLCDSIQCTGIE